MCQAKINDHFGSKYTCLRPDIIKYSVKITYNHGHMKGKSKLFNKTLCFKHSKLFKYNCNRKADKGHTVKFINIIKLN